MKNEKLSSPSILLRSFITLTSINKILTQNSTIITSVSDIVDLNYDGILGIGWGVFAIICAIFVGLAICIFGFSTTYKVVFFCIGITIPVLIFLIMVFTPVQMNEKINISENQDKNPYAIARYLILGLVAAALLTLIIPFMKFWTVVLIPQRVDSRSQREYMEKYGNVFVNKISEDFSNNKPDGDQKGVLNKDILSSQPQILSFNYSSNVNPNEQDIEMGNVENIVSKERKRRLKALARKRNQEDDLF